MALLVCLSLVVLGGAGAGWVYLKLNGNIQTFDAGGLSDNRPAGSSKGENVLVIGSDARTDGNAALGGGDDGGARAHAVSGEGEPVGVHRDGAVAQAHAGADVEGGEQVGRQAEV